MGDEYVKQGNYEMLGRLYGLTPDQIDRLMSRGTYAQSGDYDDSPSPRKPSPDRDVLANPRNDPDEWNMLLAMKNNK